MPEEEVWLHKFRATFALAPLWAGVDLRTVQDWMGHKDIASTMRYLKPQRGAKMQQDGRGYLGFCLGRTRKHVRVRRNFIPDRDQIKRS